VRIDAHQHFWRYDPVELTWIDDSMAALRRDFLPEQLAPELAASGVERCVAVQARSTPAETDFLLALAERHPIVSAVVGWVDLLAPDLEARLDALARRPKLAGFRHIAQAEPDDFLARPEVVGGVAALAGRGFAFDLLVIPRQLPAAIALARALPEQRFVLDHLAKPPIRERAREPWAGRLRELAALPNVSCKLSGMVTEANWQAWRPEDLAPYFEVALEAFGPARLMFGSDWPVCLVASGYARWSECVNAWIAPLSTAERAAVLGGNAARFYRLAEA
jgi:L-fuconolactonase